MSPLAANRSADDPSLYTTPYYHVKKGYPNTDGVNNVLSANRFAAKRFRCQRGGHKHSHAAARIHPGVRCMVWPMGPAASWHGVGALIVTCVIVVSCILVRRVVQRQHPHNTITFALTSSGLVIERRAG